MFHDVLLIARGTVLGQAPFVIASPLITRLYAPGELGIYGLTLAFVGIVSPMAGLRYELAAISARDPQESRSLLLLSALAIIPVTMLSTAALGLLKLAGIGSYNLLSWTLVGAAAALIGAAGVYSTLRSRSVRHYQFKILANSIALQGSIRAAVPLALAPLGAGAPALVGAELLARIASVWMLTSGMTAAARFASLRISPSLMATAAKLWKYPLLLAPSALMDATAIALPLPIIASCYDIAAAGKFALAQRLVMLPASLIASSVGDVFHAHAAASTQSSSGATRRLALSTARRLLLVALCAYLPVAAVAPFAAAWLFGQSWSAVGALIAALVPSCIAQTVVSPLSRSLLLNNREERKLIADVICLILPTSTLYLASAFSITSAVACFSIASVVAFVFYFTVILTSLEKDKQG